MTTRPATVPLDLWAYQLHRQLDRRPQVLELLGHSPAPELPAELVDPARPPAPELLAPFAQELDDSAAAIADWLRDAGPRAVMLLSLYTGRGPAPDLAPPLVEPGWGLSDLQVVVEHLGARALGSAQLPDPPQLEGYRTNRRPFLCRACAARLWSATPTRPGTTTVQLEDSGTVHRCPGR